ncbi:MAG TPA: ATP synthase F1 subunit delta [Chitinispirillaceae bacterium]|nr:ATP synthase F1 subunit delta [Chitinispirillaceae bacterium]
MSSQAISRNYAQAFFSAAHDADKLQHVRKDVDLLIECFKSGSTFFGQLSSPGFSQVDRLNILSKALGNHVSDLTRNFLSLIVQHKRQNLLLQILEEFNVVADKKQNLLKATLTSACQLDSGQKHKLQQSLQQKTGCILDIEFRVDPKLLAGFILVYGETMFDCSTVSTLNRFRETLKSLGT